MRWLNEARVDIVKRSGLQAESYALVRMIDSYLRPGTSLMKLAANTATDEVMQRARAAIPAPLQRFVGIEIARRWAVPESPQEELLGRVAECFHILDALLLYSREIAAGELPERPEEFLATVMRPSCLQVDPSLIPLRFAADTGDSFTYRNDEVKRDQPTMELALGRYGEPPIVNMSADMEEIGAGLHSIARHLFGADGHVVTTVQLRAPNGRWELMVPIMNDKREKFLTWHMIGAKVRTEGHDALVTTSEVWLAPPETELEPYLDVSSVPGRGEGIATWLEAPSGPNLSWSSEIGRLLNTAHLLPSRRSEVDVASAVVGFAAPVWYAWRQRGEGPEVAVAGE